MSSCLAGFFEDGTVCVREISKPTLAGTSPGTTVIRGVLAALCGSDLGCFHKPRAIDEYEQPYLRVHCSCPGASVHEVIGIVEDINGGSMDGITIVCVDGRV